MTHRTAFALFAAFLIAAPASAQMMGGGPPEPDTPISAKEKAAVIESLAVAVRDRYVFADKGAQLAKILKQRYAKKEYDKITSSKEFADSLLAHMQDFTHDKHMRVHYRYEPFPIEPGDDTRDDTAERKRMLETNRLRNFGFEKVQRLAGNVGYLELRMFDGMPEAQPTAIAAMNFLGNCDAIIIDLRKNGGGSPAMIQTLLTYFTEEGDRLHINDFYLRRTDSIEQFYTASYVPGPRLFGKPLYVLTSPLTGSAAEEFAYDVQTHKLGTIYGAVSGGAANPGGMFRLSEHLGAFIATGRAINPVTKTNWEGVGVKPDVAVPPGDALREAHVAALTKLSEKADDARKQQLAPAIEQAKKTVSDPAEDFERRMRRQVQAQAK